jgi:hypothetical protein
VRKSFLKGMTQMRTNMARQGNPMPMAGLPEMPGQEEEQAQAQQPEAAAPSAGPKKKGGAKKGGAKKK